MRLTQLLDASARNFADRIAIVDGDRQLSYSELRARVGRAAGLFRKLGIGAEDRVCILALNSHRNLEALFAACFAGGIAAPLNTRLTQSELCHIVSRVEARTLLVDEEHLELGRRIRDRSPTVRHLVLLSDRAAPPDCVDFEQGLEEAVEPEDSMRGGEDVATLFFTGGTTGLPKGVMQTHANLVTSALMYVARWRWDESIVLLGSAPMFHVAAAAVIPPVLLAGGRIVMLPRFTPTAYLNAIEQHQVTFANGVPTMFRMILDSPEIADRHLSSVRGMNYGGSPMPAAMLKELVAAFPKCRFYATYGLTEVTSAVTVSRGVSVDDPPAEDWEWTTIGYSSPLTDVRVLGPGDRECAAGEIGEIAIRGPLVMKGYWRDDAATRQALRGGWFRSGDLGTHDGRGNFFLVDRAKDMIISGGENVYSAEVESVIREMEGVADVAVIGLPDPIWGERVHAIIVPCAGSAPDEGALMAHCRSRIAGYKCPRSVEYVRESLPVSGAGKVAKAVLRAQRLVAA